MDAAGKRFLPTWMFERSAQEERRENRSGESSFQFHAQASNEHSLQNMIATDLDHEKEFLRQEAQDLDEKPPPVCFETRRPSRKSGRGNMTRSTTTSQKHGLRRNIEGKAASKQSPIRAQSVCDDVKKTVRHSQPINDVQVESLFLARENVGLTVEDLVCIAEEYVNAEKGKQHRREANEEFRLEHQKQRSSVFPQNPSGLLHGAAGSGLHNSKCVSIPQSPCSIAADVVEDAGRSMSHLGTGHVAQGMLDVLLGHLLVIPSDGNMTELETVQGKDL